MRTLGQRSAARRLVEAGIDTPSAGLADGSVDVALIWPPVDVAGLELHVLASEPRVAVLPAGHRLARRQAISIDQLADDLAVCVATADSQWAGFWVGAPERSRPPVLGPTSRSMAGLFALVAAGDGVGLSPAGLAASMKQPLLAFVPATDIPPATLAVAWREDSQPPLVALFAHHARDTARDERARRDVVG